MKHMALALAVVALVLSVLVLSACGGTATEPTDGFSSSIWWDITVDQVVLPDGREVTCIYVSGGNDGGLSCDWLQHHEGSGGG